MKRFLLFLSLLTTVGYVPSMLYAQTVDRPGFLENLPGTYRRTPIENDWHVGSISVDVSGEKPVITWKNQAGVSWKLFPKQGTPLLTTDETNPYFEEGRRDFVMVIEGDQVLGFKFGAGIFAHENFTEADTRQVMHDLMMTQRFLNELKETAALHGRDSLEAINLQGKIAGIMFWRERYTDAAALFGDNQKRKRAFLGTKENESLLASQLTYGLSLLEAGRVTEARSAYEIAKEISSKVYASELGILEGGVLSGFGKVLFCEGRYSEAAAQFEKTRDFYLLKKGESADDTLVTGLELAKTYELLGQTREAEALYGQVLEASPSEINNIAPRCLMALERPQEAEKIFRECIALAREQEQTGVGYLSPRVRADFAICLRKLQKYEEADREFELVSRRMQGRWGKGHPAVARLELEYARSLAEQGKADDARERAQRALAIQRQLLAENHPERQLTETFLAELGEE